MSKKKAAPQPRAKRNLRPPPPEHVGRSDDGNAFIPDFTEGHSGRARDDMAEQLGEEFVQSATSGEEVGEDVRDAWVSEEIGGPFVETRASEEFAHDIDPANPRGAEREPFPTANRVR